VAAHNQLLDQADPQPGRIALGDGQVWHGQAIDGKEVRGRVHMAPTRFWSVLVRHESAYVLGQAAVDVKTNEITAVPALLAGRGLRGRLRPWMPCSPNDVSAADRGAGRHYLMVIKKNQPTLYWAADLVFREPPQPVRPGEVLRWQTTDKAHGRLERRTLLSTTALNDYLQRPAVAQVLCRTCRRVHLRTGQVEIETTYGLTSLRGGSPARSNWSTSGATTGHRESPPLRARYDTRRRCLSGAYRHGAASAGGHPQRHPVTVQVPGRE